MKRKDTMEEKRKEFDEMINENFNDLSSMAVVKAAVRFEWILNKPKKVKACK